MIESMLESGFYNMDCMKALHSFPDKFFDLLIADPPYGGGARNDKPVAEMINGGGQLTGNIQSAADSVEGLTATTLKLTRTGGTWSRKYQRERRRRTTSDTGMSLRHRNTSKRLPA